jgi:hypothetical protein
MYMVKSIYRIYLGSAKTDHRPALTSRDILL